MKINDFIRVAYSARIKETSQMFDKSENIPTIIGAGLVIKGLEEALKEMNVGEKKSVEIPPEKGFGNRDPKLIKLITISEFRKHEINPQPGMLVEVDNLGERTLTLPTNKGRVLSVSSGRVSVDFNHPLAGKTLIYDVEIKERIEKPEDKIKTLIEIYTRINKISVIINNKEVEIIVPPLINPIYKKKIADDVIKFLDLEKVKFSEIFEKPKEDVKN